MFLLFPEYVAITNYRQMVFCNVNSLSPEDISSTSRTPCICIYSPVVNIMILQQQLNRFTKSIHSPGGLTSTRYVCIYAAYTNSKPTHISTDGHKKL